MRYAVTSFERYGCGKDDAVSTDAAMIMRLRSVQDTVRLMLGNADAVEADAVIFQYADAVD